MSCIDGPSQRPGVGLSQLGGPIHPVKMLPNSGPLILYNLLYF